MDISTVPVACSTLHKAEERIGRPQGAGGKLCTGGSKAATATAVEQTHRLV